MRRSRRFVVFGLGFGDEGKGSVVDFLTRRYDAVRRAVVRYNGGPQAGHNVVAPDGRWHCFAQFGAGTFVSGTMTILARNMLVEPENLEAEYRALAGKGVADAMSRLVIDERCVVVTPMHKMIGRLREIARGGKPHGSCGMGVGQAILDMERGRATVTVRDVLDGKSGLWMLQAVVEEKMAEAASLLGPDASPEAAETVEYFRGRANARELADRYLRIFRDSGLSVGSDVAALRTVADEGGAVVFEGAQGALLDRYGGFAPYVTKSRATWHNACSLIAEASPHGRSGVSVEKIGVLRAYGHRHGAGPFVTEDEGLRPRFDDPLNRENRWQGPFRVGWLDLVAIRYGIALNGGADGLALTGLDRLSGLRTVRVCASYLYRGDLSALPAHVAWDRLGADRARITKLWAPDADAGARLTAVLARCTPCDWIAMPGWAQDISSARGWTDLPRRAQAFVRFLESDQGLDVPVRIVSVRPDATGKFFLDR